jgi:hypothetical protein
MHKEVVREEVQVQLRALGTASEATEINPVNQINMPETTVIQVADLPLVTDRYMVEGQVAVAQESQVILLEDTQDGVMAVMA